MRVLIVKLSSLGDVVHAMPVVHDMLRVHPEARIDWVVEPGFAPLLARMHGLADVIECPLHNGRFDIRDGRALGAPACVNLKTYPAKVEDGFVFIQAD